MKVRKTEKLDYNYRRSVLGLGSEEYQALQAGKVVDVDEDAGKKMIMMGVAEKAEAPRKKE